METSIIGCSHVGKTLNEIFKSAIVYTPDIKEDLNPRNIVNKTVFGFISVPVQRMSNGEINISIIEDIVKWLKTEIIVIATTIPPGTTDYLIKKYRKRIVFSPIPEKVNNFGWPICICGGDKESTQQVIDLFGQHLKKQKIYRQTTAKTAELYNYMENLWLTMQITFANEFYNICEKMEINYCELRDLWSLNPKISEYRTAVSSNSRGYSDNNLNNSLSAMISFLEQIELTSYLFDGVSRANNFNLRKNLEASVNDRIQDQSVIKFYQIDQSYGFLSNFSHHPIYLKNKIWMTSEHYYQAQKCVNTEYEEKVRLTHSPVKAARMGQSKKYPVRSDWLEIKNDIMREALYAKFTQHPDLKAELIKTFPAKLVEHTKNDSYWGDGGDGSGKNMLGKILMEIRSALK